jgi:hypothetical protein
MRVSLDDSGNEVSCGTSLQPAMSGDGNYVLFLAYLADNSCSFTSDSVTPVRVHVYLRDITAGRTHLVSVDGGAMEFDRDSTDAIISRDGSYIGFASKATNLGASGAYNQIYYVLTSDILAGAPNPQIATVDWVNYVEGDADSRYPSFSGPDPLVGAIRFVVFYSTATNLVAGDTNAAGDVLTLDLYRGALARVSTAFGSGALVQGNNLSGMYGPAATDDGLYCIFPSSATNLVAGDTNGQADIFVGPMP